MAAPVATGSCLLCSRLTSGLFAMLRALNGRLFIAGLLCLSVPAFADDFPANPNATRAGDVDTEKADTEKPVAMADAQDSDPLAGHSFHGEAFDDGPRQAAYLMSGLNGVSFPSSANQQAQRFIDQAVAQLHGFWYYEAERSFRQAAVFDPDCAICYWGMALANRENRERARGFIEEAVERMDSATRREQMFIKAAQAFYREKDDKGKKISRKDRAQKYTHDLEEIVGEFPDDIEARALLGLQLWHSSREGLPITSYVAVDSVLQDVFDANPMHPAHHYRIHLWDRKDAAKALKSAALCGASLPAIAHMWHMPGHIYSKLHRYEEAVWQQEASARVDHAHMMRDRVLPDQIHNFAHNNEWLIRNLIKIGRVRDAVDLAQNMLELPRHPKYNSLKKGSARYGRIRLIMALSTYRLWDEMVHLCNSRYLAETGDEELDTQRLGWLGFAAALADDQNNYQLAHSSLTEQISAIESELEEIELADEEAEKEETEKTAKASESKETESSKANDDAEANNEKTSDEETSGSEEQDDADEACESEDPPADAKSSEADEKKAAANRARAKKERRDESKKLKARKSKLNEAIAKVEAGKAAADGDFATALKRWKAAKLDDDLLKSEWLAASGEIEDAQKLIDKTLDKLPGEVLPPAVACWIAHKYTDNSKARDELFGKTCELASSADLDTPLLGRLAPIAKELGSDSDWASEFKVADDFGERPALDSLGPFRWSPYIAPDFEVTDPSGQVLTNADLAGKPTLVIFYLGFGCLHCVEQLHEFSPEMDKFREAGIDMVAISSEDQESLNEGLNNFGKQLNIPLHSDSEMQAFKAFRCYDDFEAQPLHGTFLIAADGSVLWQDISYDPFMDAEFALSEAKRLLTLRARSVTSASPEVAASSGAE